MLFKLFRWVPVVLGLKVAGMAPVTQMPEIAESERPAWITAENDRVSTGVLETSLKSSTSDIADIEAPSVRVTGFVMRPLPAHVQRPTSRLKTGTSKGAQTARFQPGQIRQSNRPTSRAKLKREGKKVAKRVVTLQQRRRASRAIQNVTHVPRNRLS